MIPIFLWSTVVNQLQKPVDRRRPSDDPGSRSPERSRSPCRSRSPPSRQAVQVGDEGVDLLVGQLVVGHLRAELHGVRVAQPRLRAPSRPSVVPVAAGEALVGRVGEVRQVRRRGRRRRRAADRVARDARRRARPTAGSGTGPSPAAASGSVGRRRPAASGSRPTPPSRSRTSATIRNFIRPCCSPQNSAHCPVVRARLVGGEQDVVRAARHDVLLAEQPGRPERVDHHVVAARRIVAWRPAARPPRATGRPSRPVGITSTSATVDRSLSPYEVAMSSSVYSKPHHHW